MTSNAEDLFIDGESWNKPALRGAFEKWIDRDWVMDNGFETSIRVKQGLDEDIVSFRNFESWVNREVEDDWWDVKREYGVDAPKETFKEYFHNSEDFRRRVMDKVEVVDPGGGVVDVDGDSSSSSSSGMYSELKDIGILDDEGDVQWKKMKGSMMLFAKEVDEILSPVEEPDSKSLREAWNRWMMNKVGSEWAKFTSHELEPGQLNRISKEMLEMNDDFSSLVNGKWEHEPEEEEGNGESENSNPNSIGGWADECGTTSELRPGDGVSDGSSVRGDVRSDDGDIGDMDDSVLGDGKSGDNEGPLSSYAEEHGTTDSLNEDFDNGNESDSTGSIVHSDNGPGTNSDGPNVDAEGEQDCEGDEGVGSVNGVSNPDDTGGEDVGTRLDSYSEEYGTTDKAGRKSEDFETNVVICGDSKESMRDMPRNSVDVAITSPPYWGGVRDYEGDVDASWDDWDGQLGHEPTPEMYVDNLMEVVEEVRRVLKPRGSFWFNVGDIYGGKTTNVGTVDEGYRPGSDVMEGMFVKSLVGMPERLMVRMIDEGWLLRNKVRWVKKYTDRDGKNHGSCIPLPPPVNDRVHQKAVEPVFHFVQQKGYKYNPEAVETPDGTFYSAAWHILPSRDGSEHVAPFPKKLVRRCIEASSDEGDTVLDPFGGTGTTGKVAMECNREYVMLEISEKYAEIARKNIPDTSQGKLM